MRYEKAAEFICIVSNQWTNQLNLMTGERDPINWVFIVELGTGARRKSLDYNGIYMTALVMAFFIFALHLTSISIKIHFHFHATYCREVFTATQLMRNVVCPCRCINRIRQTYLVSHLARAGDRNDLNLSLNLVHWKHVNCSPSVC